MLLKKLGQKVDELPRPSPVNSLQTRPIIAAFLRSHKDVNLESLICSTLVCKVSRQCKWDGAAPECKSYPYSIDGLTHDLYSHENLKGYDINIADQVVAFHGSKPSQNDLAM